MQQKNSILFALALFCLRLTGLHAQAVKDFDGNFYPTIIIGKQIWIAENLKTTKLNDGTVIPLATDDKKWSELKVSGYCWYNNDITNKDVYGALYNWYSVNTKKLCPKGWHVPNITEWNDLLAYLGDINFAADKLKEAGSDHWVGNVTATNESDFTALPGGMRQGDGSFPIFGSSYAVWWSSTEFDAITSWNRGMINSSRKVYKGHENKRNGFSVRCIKD